jgi:large subunit ribosomal protein L35
MLELPTHFGTPEQKFDGISMPKNKTKRAASKRFTVKASGKIKRGKANKRHILTKKTRARKNKLKKGGYVHASDMPNVIRCLPNG